MAGWRIPPVSCIAFLGLAACAAQPDLRVPTSLEDPVRQTETPRAALLSAGECGLRKVATLPITVVDDAILVQGRVAGRDAVFIVDTGAEQTSLTAEAVAGFGLMADPTTRTRSIGTGGGVVERDNAVMTGFELGPIKLDRVSVAVRPIARAAPAERPVIGLLGGWFLSHYDVDLNVPAREISLFQPAECLDPGPHWSKASRIAANPLGRHKLTVPIGVNGQDLTALLDSGAAYTIITVAGAARLGVGADLLDRDKTVPGGLRGVDQQVVPAVMHEFDGIQIGAGYFPKPEVPVASLHLDRDGIAEMVLGADFFTHNRVFIAYHSKTIFVRDYGLGHHD